MDEVILRVGPAAGGWSVDCDLLEPTFYRSGARAEAVGRELAAHLSGAGRNVRMLVSDRTERLVVSQRYFGALETVS